MYLKTKLNHLLAIDRLDQALDLLLEKLTETDQDIYNTLVLLKSRFVSNEKDNNLGIVSHDEYKRSKAQITNALQQTIKQYPNDVLVDKDDDKKVLNPIFAKYNNNIVELRKSYLFLSGAKDLNFDAREELKLVNSKIMEITNKY